ncbi:AraC family ligand binding domain-containing protein [Rhodoferax sp.]|uniref:AraC family transcriptional regulator n=1 Tax=Rhodoferax sp. TaxID=50421 RepID=UPI00374CC059
MDPSLTTTLTDWARFRPGAGTGMTLMQAHFTDHAFERHSHDSYAIGLTHSGVQTFHCRGALHASQAGDVILFNPDEPHDGSRGTDAGFGYSMLYVDPAVVQAWRDGAAGTQVCAYFKSPLIHDPQAAQALQQAMAAAAQPQERLRAEELASAALVGLLRRYGERPGAAASALDAGRARMDQARAYIAEYFADDLTVERLAQQVGLSRVHFTRAFGQHFGVPPHVYLNAVRLRQAQTALLSGQPLAQAALSAGFSDQSHFNRRFKGSFGVSPGNWLAQMGRVAAQE